MGKGELNISESRIKELHKAIMYEDSPGEKEKIGKWKMQPNHVYNYRDEKFEFADPYEVADKIHELVNWVNAEKEKIEAGKKNALHPVELAFDFHLRYLTIHPFYDGNGRTGRILTNVILISHGYPPIYIKDDEKSSYYLYLADVQAYGADKYMLFELMSDYLIRSLNIVSDAIAGKEIEEPEDIDKKIQLLERELNTVDPDDQVKEKYSKTIFIKCQKWISKLILAVIPVVEKFNRFFVDNRHAISLPQAGIYEPFLNRPASAVIGEMQLKIAESQRIDHFPQDVIIQAYYDNLIKGGLKSFSCDYSISIKFNDIKYEVFVDDFDEATAKKTVIKKYERLLHQSLTEEEMNDSATMLGNAIFKYIDFYTKKNGLRK
jgi:fido (protein-threonine AMPylation protein)